MKPSIFNNWETLGNIEKPNLLLFLLALAEKGQVAPNQNYPTHLELFFGIAFRDHDNFYKISYEERLGIWLQDKTILRLLY